MKTIKLDERQILERGKAFFHGVIAAVILLLGNAALQDAGIIWASGFAQNVIIMFAILTVVTVEMVIRDCYFGQSGQNLLLMLIFVLIAFALSITTVTHIVKGDVLFTNGAFTKEGEHLPQAILTLVMAASMAIKEIKRRTGKAEE
jgi:hypothetical protein